ncbi:MAG: carbonic anhydrase [Candidatus Thermoplasmatota archaeon]|nr:carbonic anhydrase [Candidatus Thermoplasmatota archaeon]
MEDILEPLKKGNKEYISKHSDDIKNLVAGQSPKIAVLTCSDSRVIPEYIFHASIGDLFVVRVAGNVAMDASVISSLEYAVDHLHVKAIIILGHTHCGAVKAAEMTQETDDPLLCEIQQSFSLQPNDHCQANLTCQITRLRKRSICINNAIEQKRLQLIGALYHLEDGIVEFFETEPREK